MTIDGILAAFSEIMQNNAWLAPLIALLAGVLTSIAPCALSNVPLIIGYVGGTGQNGTKRAFLLSVVFAGGTAVSFTAMGVAAALLGHFIGIGENDSWWHIALGVLMVMMALQIFGIFEFLPSSRLVAKNTRRGYVGAFIAGILGGIFSSPCATPVLVVLLSIVAQSGNIAWGIFLLSVYSVGHSFLVIVAGTSFGFVNKLIESEKYGAMSNYIKYATGVLVLLIAFYMFYLGF